MDVVIAIKTKEKEKFFSCCCWCAILFCVGCFLFVWLGFFACVCVSIMHCEKISWTDNNKRETNNKRVIIRCEHPIISFSKCVFISNIIM